MEVAHEYRMERTRLFQKTSSLGCALGECLTLERPRAVFVLYSLGALGEKVSIQPTMGTER
jgi:hypothetical protein